MPAVHLEVGLPLTIDGRMHSVSGWYEEKVVLLPDGGKDIVLISQTEIANGIARKQIELKPAFSGSVDPEKLRTNLEKDISELEGPTLAEFERRRSYISAICAEHPKSFTPQRIEPIVRRHAKQRGDHAPPHFSSLYRWFREYKCSGFDVRALIPNFNKRGNTKRRLQDGVLQIIEEEIQKKFLRPERLPVTSLASDIWAAIELRNRTLPAEEKLRFPHERTIYRMVAKINPYVYTIKRHGERAAFVKYNGWIGGVRVTRVLERVEVDHTKLDMFLIDERYGLPVGRPWLTFAIDVYSGLPVGFHLSFDPPSWQTVMACLRHAILPKDDECAAIDGIENSWDAYGVPDTLVVDNGAEFHSKQFELACEHLNIHVLHTQARCPWLKGSIERMFGTLNKKFLAGTRGYTFSNTVEKGEYDPKKNAVMDLPTLRDTLVRWIVDVYSQTVKRPINDIPARRWRESVASHPQRLPATITDLAVSMFSTDERVVHPYGIEREGIFYHSEALAELRRKLGEGQRVRIRYNPNDLGSIFVIHDQFGPAFEVPAKDQEYAAGLTSWQHKVIQRYRRMVNDAEGGKVSLAVSKRRLIDAANETLAEKRKARGKAKAKRFVQKPEPPSDADDNSTPPQALPAAEATPLDPSGRPAEPTSTPEEDAAKSRDMRRRLGNDDDWGR